MNFDRFNLKIKISNSNFKFQISNCKFEIWNFELETEARKPGAGIRKLELLKVPDQGTGAIRISHSRADFPDTRKRPTLLDLASIRNPPWEVLWGESHSGFRIYWAFPGSKKVMVISG